MKSGIKGSGFVHRYIVTGRKIDFVFAARRKRLEIYSSSLELIV